MKLLRAQRQITQSYLAVALNITVKTVSHWETGYCEPSISQLVQLADFFEVTVDELIGRNANY